MAYDVPDRWPYQMRMRNISATATATADDQMIIKVAASSISLWLPSAVGIQGKQIVIKNIATGTLVIDGDASQTIDGALSDTVGVNQSKILISNGSNWYII